MSGLRRRLLGVCGALHLLALACWLAAIVATGVAATAVFTMLPRVGVVVTGFEPYVERLAAARDAARDADSPADLAREHGRIAGGMVMDPVFRWSDRVQAGLSAVSVLTLVAAGLGVRGARSRCCGLHRSVPNVLRFACMLAAGALVAWQLGVLGPRMASDLHGWWAAARDGDLSGADALRASFDADHVLANRLYNVRLLLVLAALALTGFAAGTPASTPTDSGRLPQDGRSP